MLSDNISVNAAGHLTFAGRDTVALAQRYGTPLYLMDEVMIRERIRVYKKAMEDFFPIGSVPEYASKAFCCKRIYEIIAEEGIHVDAVSMGELYTAKQAGFPLEKCFFHGNNKTDEELLFALENGIGRIVADNEDEVEALDRLAREKGVCQPILLRVTPEIDPHTHKKISTGSVESKFGVAIMTGQAMALTKRILSMKGVRLLGFHCHIGSQIFDAAPFGTAAEIMLKFLDEVRTETGYTAEYLNLGGGFGVRYVETDPVIDYRARIREVADHLNRLCDTYQFPCPKIGMEPGRSLVADAGMTLYTVGSVKEIPGYCNYVSVDGGMTDNPRYTLYEAVHTVLNASHADQKPDFTATVAGRCCESGDLIGENVSLKKPRRGDVLAVLTTGAYNYSMASNYNRVPRPPVLMLDREKEYLAVRRETVQDLCALDE